MASSVTRRVPVDVVSIGDNRRVDTELWVAIIGGLFSVVVAAVGWVIARQDRSDERANISRDLEILSALNPDSPSYTELEKRISQNIAQLVTEQNYKDFARPFYRRYFWFIAVTILLVGIALLRGEKWEWREIAQVVNVLLWVPWAALAASLIWLPLKGLYLLIRLMWMKVQLWMLERQRVRLSDRRDAAQAQLDAAQSYTRELLLHAARTGARESEVLAFLGQYPRGDEDDSTFVQQLEADIRAVYEQNPDENENPVGSVDRG